MSNPAVKSIPEGMHTLTPHLVCAGAADALARRAWNRAEREHDGSACEADLERTCEGLGGRP